jgi:hypothetical protein
MAGACVAVFTHVRVYFRSKPRASRISISTVEAVQVTGIEAWFRIAKTKVCHKCGNCRRLLLVAIRGAYLTFLQSWSWHAEGGAWLLENDFGNSSQRRSAAGGACAPPVKSLARRPGQEYHSIARLKLFWYLFHAVLCSPHAQVGLLSWDRSTD